MLVPTALSDKMCHRYQFFCNVTERFGLDVVLNSLSRDELLQTDSSLASAFIIKMWCVRRSDGTAYRHRTTMQTVCGASGGEGG